MTQRSNRSKDDVAGIIKSILVADKKSSTIGVPIVQLEDEYRSQDGTRIPYRALGYACLMDFLESLQRKGEITIGKRNSMPVVYLCVDEKIAHVSALVSGQRDSRRCSRGGKRNTSRSYPRLFYQPPKLDSKTLADVIKLIKNAPNGIHIYRIIEYLRDRNNSHVSEHHLIQQLRDVYHEVSVENSVIYPITKKQVHPQNSQPNFDNSKSRYAAEKNPSTAWRPAGLSDDEEDNEAFELVTKIENGQPPPANNDNHRYEESQAAAINLDKIAETDLQKRENCPVDDNDDIGILVNSRTRFRLEKLIQKHENGIWCAELPGLYHKEYSIPLNYEDLGFGNVSDFAAHLPEIFHCVRLQENGDFKLFDAKCPKPETRENPRPEQLSLAALHSIYESYTDESEPVPMLLSPTTSQRLVPEGVMTIGETVAQIGVTELFSDNTPHIDVIVVDTVTPTFFWIQLLRKTQKFDRFMRDLHAFYSQHASKYLIPIVLLERGLNCACIYDKKWHRAVIKAVKPNNTVTVLFYDYGTVLTYPPQNIHFLHRSFSSLPAQAIPCGLYNVKPVATEKWPYSVCQVFAEKVLDVPMVAMLGSIDVDNNSMLIALTNTEGLVDFHISDWMINSGFAVYGKMGETVDTNEKYESTTGGPQETSPRLPTIEESSNIPGSSNLNTMQNRQLAEAYEIELAKMRDSMETELKGFLKQIISSFNSQLQLSAEQTQGQREASVSLDEWLDNIKIDPLNKQQGANSEPPPLPPRPNKTYTPMIGSHEIQSLPKIQSFNDNKNFQENTYMPTQFQKCDVNMNCAENPFDYSTAKNIMTPSYNFDYQLPFNNDNQSNLTMWSNFINNKAPPAAAPRPIVTPPASARVPPPIVTSQALFAVPPPIVTPQTSAAIPPPIVTPQVSAAVPPPIVNPQALFAVRPPIVNRQALFAVLPAIVNPQAFAAVTPPILTPQTPVVVSQAPVNVGFQDPAVLRATPATFYPNIQENFLNIVPDMQAKDPISLIKPREAFEMSLEQSAKSFFARLDAKCKPKNQETNPFKVPTESDELEKKTIPPIASALPQKNSVINPFAPEVEASQRDKTSSPRVIYSEGPIKYDFSSENKTQGKLDAEATAATLVKAEREKLEAAKLMDVESWIAQGNNSKVNYGNNDVYQVSNGKQSFDPSFTGDFPSRGVSQNISTHVRTSNVFPSIPARPGAAPCESQISDKVFEAPNEYLHSTSDSGANYVESEFLRAASGGLEYPSGKSSALNVEGQEERSQDIAAYSPLTVEIKREERLRKEEVDGGNLPMEQNVKTWSTGKMWDFKEIHLTKTTVYLINLDNEGWLTVEEFTTAFTTHQTPDIILKILDIQDARIPFRFIQRVDHPTLFARLDRTSLAVPRNHKNQISDILHLVPLKSILKMLRKLKLVDVKEIQLATKKQIFPSRSSVLHDAYTIIIIYANI